MQKITLFLNKTLTQPVHFDPTDRMQWACGIREGKGFMLSSVGGGADSVSAFRSALVKELQQVDAVTADPNIVSTSADGASNNTRGESRLASPSVSFGGEINPWSSARDEINPWASYGREINPFSNASATAASAAQQGYAAAQNMLRGG